MSQLDARLSKHDWTDGLGGQRAVCALDKDYLTTVVSFGHHNQSLPVFLAGPRTKPRTSKPSRRGRS